MGLTPAQEFITVQWISCTDADHLSDSFTFTCRPSDHYVRGFKVVECACNGSRVVNISPAKGSAELQYATVLYCQT